MKKTKLLVIVGSVIALALICVVLVGIISGQWPWQNNDWANDYTGVPTEQAGQTESADETTLPDTTDAEGSVEEPSVGVEIEGEDTSGSGNSGSSSGSGNSGNSGSSGGGKTEIDFDDLLSNDKKPAESTKPTESTKPAETEPSGTEQESTKPSETTPDTESGGQAGERPEDTDIDVPIN